MEETYKEILQTLQPKDTLLIAVSKRQPLEKIIHLYELGHRDFGENYVQELVEKKNKLPHDIRWHFIGHLQRNKVKYITPFIYMIHSVDSIKLLYEIQKKTSQQEKFIKVLFQINVANEKSKSGISINTFDSFLKEAINLKSHFSNIIYSGLMGITPLDSNELKKKTEFKIMQNLFTTTQRKLNDTSFTNLSLGMSDDYNIAIKYGSTYVRIGTKLFGERR